eukprot:52644_1
MVASVLTFCVLWFVLKANELTTIDDLLCPVGEEMVGQTCVPLICVGGNANHQIGAINADIAGCGIEGCDARYDKATVADCNDHCEATSDCVAYSWAPLNGDRNHRDKIVCTIYDNVNQNQQWTPNQILCLSYPLKFKENNQLQPATNMLRFLKSGDDNLIAFIEWNGLIVISTVITVYLIAHVIHKLKQKAKNTCNELEEGNQYLQTAV